MSRFFVHPLLDREHRAVAGSYAFIKEVRLPIEDREVLYLVGYGVMDTSCCGTGGVGYARVPGTVVKWRYAENENGRPVSEVEPIVDREFRERIRAAIIAAEQVGQVQFGE